MINHHISVLCLRIGRTYCESSACVPMIYMRMDARAVFDSMQPRGLGHGAMAMNDDK